MADSLKVIKDQRLHKTRIELNIGSVHIFNDEYLHRLVSEYGKDTAIDYVANIVINYMAECIKNEVSDKAIDILI